MDLGHQADQPGACAGRFVQAVRVSVQDTIKEASLIENCSINSS